MALRSLRPVETALLCVALGACLFVSARLIGKSLRQVARLTEINSSEEPPAAPGEATQRTEDSLDPDTLSTLARSPNYNISDSALTLLCTRVSHNPASLRLLAAALSLSAPQASRRRGKLVAKALNEFAPRSQAPASTVPRHHDESPEEQEVRRRRRQAMVFNDGDRPVAREDIIEPELE